MIQLDTFKFRQIASSLKNNAESISDIASSVDSFGNKVQSAWISQASSEYVEKVKRLSAKMRDIAADFNGLSQRMNGYVDEMIEADKEAAGLFGGTSSGGSSTSGTSTGGVIDRYKAKDYSDKGIAGSTGYAGEGGYYYQDDPSGGDPAVAPFNDKSGWVSCTFSTMYRLHKKGLGYPFETVGNTSGGQWFDNYAGASENRYTGVEGFRQMIDEYMASDQTEPLRNVVVSFSSGEYGHVMLIDGIHKNGEITFYDNSWGEGFGTKLYADNLTMEAAMNAVDNAPVHGMQVEEFLKYYGYMHMNGAVIIGNN